MKLKVCGMREKDNISALVGLQPDYIGFIFWKRSLRYCTDIPKDIPKDIKKVGVFVNETTEKIKSKVEAFELDFVQLHGEESPEQCLALQPHCEVIKAFRIGPHFDFKTTKPYHDHCAYFLFDTEGPLPGGNGSVFDWEQLKNYNQKTPFFLSGGIGLGHIGAITEIRKLNLPIHALDINSKFESKPGLKKMNDIKTFKNQLNL